MQQVSLDQDKPLRRRPFEIVPAKRSDMDLVAEFVRSSADWYRPIVDEKDMGEHAVDDEWARTNFERRDFYIGRASGKPIGTISLQYFGKYAYLGYIYLDVAYVGNGYGQKLMKYAESVARRKGMRGMSLIAHPEATWAKRAYLKYGFEIIASDKPDVLAWQEGALQPYYEEGFELYLYDFARDVGPGELSA
jgi:GNAT superfamily N-acetyltransferase